MAQSFVVLDFGSQYTQLIARRLRELNYSCVILPYTASIDDIKNFNPFGVIFSGGPQSVYDKVSPKRSVLEIAELFPVLGVCYGMQLMVQELGGEVKPSSVKEYGSTKLKFKNLETLNKEFINNDLKFEKDHKVWMSHGDSVSNLPNGFRLIAESESGHPAWIEHNDKSIMGIQFHPEVTHSKNGFLFLEYFASNVSKAHKNWSDENVLERMISEVKHKVPENEKVICGLSGGVDSTVVATLITQALGKERVQCIFVDTGLLRKNEFKSVLENYKSLDLNIKGVDAKKEFYSALKGKSDPEDKRLAIGHTFIDVFKKEAESLEGTYNWLAQGTLYPDVIESVSPNGESVTIKSHHNVGGLPEDLNLNLLEPVRELFKDEVRKIGLLLGISPDLIGRHPFPGPGLGIRILGEVSEDKVKTLQEADDIFIQSLLKHNIYNEIWQAFCVLLPVKTVGVQGDSRSYEWVLSLRAVTSIDGMTAEWYDFDAQFLRKVSNRITNQVPQINRVVYDITSKPPGTIEWE